MAYTALVGWFDCLTGSGIVFHAAVPRQWLVARRCSAKSASPATRDIAPDARAGQVLDAAS